MGSNYIQQALDAIREELPPDIQEEQVPLYALLALTKGTAATVADVHDVWAVWCRNPDHPCLVPFEQLPPESREQDQPFLAGVHRAARRLRDEQPGGGMTHQFCGDQSDLSGDDLWAVTARVDEQRKTVAGMVATATIGIQNGYQHRVVYQQYWDLLGHARTNPATIAAMLTAAVQLLAEQSGDRA